MQDVKVSFSADTTKFNNGVKNINSGLANIRSSIGNTGKIVAGLGVALAGLATYKLTSGFVSLVKSSSQAAAGFETAAIQLEVLTGSAEKANMLLSELKDYGATTPLQFGDLLEATTTLANFNVGVDSLIPTLRMLGDVSKGDAEKLRSLATVYGQVFANGKLQGGDNLQFINAGFNPLNQITKILDVSMMEVRDKMAKGEIGIDLVTQALKKATSEGGTFYRMLERSGNTTEGKWSNLVDDITNLKIALGGELNVGVRDALNAANQFLPKLTSTFEKIGNNLGRLVVNLIKIVEPKLEAFANMLQNGGSLSSSIGTFVGSILSDPKLISGIKSIVNETVKGLLSNPDVKKLGTGGLLVGGAVAAPYIKSILSTLKPLFAPIASLGKTMMPLLSRIGVLLVPIAPQLAALAAVLATFAIAYEGGKVLADKFIKGPKDVEGFSDEFYNSRRSATEKFEREKELAKQGEYDFTNSDYKEGSAKYKILQRINKDSREYQNWYQAQKAMEADIAAKEAANKPTQKELISDAIRQINDEKDRIAWRKEFDEKAIEANKAMDAYEKRTKDLQAKDKEKKDSVWDKLQALQANLPTLDLMNRSSQITSLAAIGGAKAYTGNTAIDLQRQANEYLKTIVRHTRPRNNAATFA